MSTPTLSGPAMTEIVNTRIGAIRVTGHLTAQGADLLRGTVQSLVQGGHTRVVVDLGQLQAADDDGLEVLRDVGRSLAESGGSLLLQSPPGWLSPDGRRTGTAPAAGHSSSVR